MNWNLSMSKWLLREDENFWSKVKDEWKRAEYLGQLYRARVVSMFMMLIFMLITALAMIQAPKVAALPLLMIASQLLIYLDADSKVRTIKLYELFSGAEKNI